MELGTFKFWPVKNEWMTTHLATCHRRRKRPSPTYCHRELEREKRKANTDRRRRSSNGNAKSFHSLASLRVSLLSLF